jgi:hypothetical protein
MGVATFVFSVTPARAERDACGPGEVSLTGFGPSDIPSRFYWAVEGTDAVATITAGLGDCTPGSSVAAATYATRDATATTPQDYQERSGSTGVLCGDRDTHAELCPDGPPPKSIQVLVPTENDGTVEAAVEPFWFAVTDATKGVVPPSQVPVHVIDRQGGSRASLEPVPGQAGAVAYSQREIYPRILIPVFLAGLSDAGTVAYSVEPSEQGSATVGQDIRIVSPSPLVISGRVGMIELEILEDGIGEGPESVRIVLREGGSVSVASPSTTTLTILDGDVDEPPSSRIRNPRHGRRYSGTDRRLRHIHVTATDQGGTLPTGVDFALRRKAAGGRCTWLGTEGWVRRGCGDKEWLAMSAEAATGLWGVDIRRLKPSVGTGIRSYTAFSRAIDAGGNIEGQFEVRRNVVRFDVLPASGKG